MGDTLAHRGPDDAGDWVDIKAGVALAHRRLAILDLSAAGHQPMQSHCDRFVMVFNGEIYNHLSLRHEIEQSFGLAQWRGHSDTETLLSGFSHWGIELTLRKLTGMFALALWDRKERVMTLARDRMGEKPLYYGWHNNHFLFGSELKALRAHPDFSGEIDRSSLVLLLRHNCVPGSNSIYKDCYKLSPGTFVQLPLDDPRPERLASKSYWSLAKLAEAASNHPFIGSDYDAVEALKRVMTESIKGQIYADVPLGALLSGGIDSSLVVSLMQANSSRPVKTFTVGFDEVGFDESTAARAIASHLGTEHTELRVTGKDALGLLPHLPLIYDEPFADSSQIPTYLVAKMTREHVKVALTGDGGDELFGGYSRYSIGPRDWKAISHIPFRVRKLIGRGLSILPDGRLQRFGGRLGSAQNFDDWSLDMITEWGGADSLVYNAEHVVSLLSERNTWPKVADPLARMMVIDAMTYLPDDILVKLDRAAMAVSLETRAPFLDRNVVELALKLPTHLKIRDGQGKWLTRQLLHQSVPQKLVNQPKKGFSIPLGIWLREPLRDWVEDLISESRLKNEGFFNPQIIRASWATHLAGKSDYSHRLWSVLMFQSWFAEQSKAATHKVSKFICTQTV
jgi:asparagine synthase (glutamine-hydrolysing)